MASANKKIAIFVKKYDSMFTNGCSQQAFYLYKLFKNIPGYITELVCIEAEYTSDINMEIHFIDINNDESFKDYCLYIMVSALISEPIVLNRLMKYGAKIIGMVCGNLYVLNQEEVIFNRHGILLNHKSNVYREYHEETWVLPMYTEFRDYVELLTETTTKVTPYVWEPDGVDMILKSFNSVYKQNIEKGQPLVICIFEPNMSIHKTSLVPLLMCEKLFKMHPHMIKKIYHFNTPENDAFTRFATSLTLHQKGLIEYQKRVIFPVIMCKISELHTEGRVVLLCNHFHNELNFLHLEAMYMGIPLVHNCQPYASAGGYYTNEQPSAGIARLIDIYENLHEIDYYQNYKDQGQKIIQYYNSQNMDNVMTYKDHFDRLTVKIMPMKKIIICVPLEKYLWFYELALPVYNSLRELSFQVELRCEAEWDFSEDALYILYCAECYTVTPKQYIVYQFEHLPSKVLFDTPEFTRFNNNLKGACMVWDFSHINLTYYQKHCVGIKLTIVPFGYHPSMTYSPGSYKDDLTNRIVFTGNLDMRRANIFSSMTRLTDKFYVVTNAWNVHDTKYGATTRVKADILYNARLVINIKLYDPQLSSLETTRIMQAMANKCLVISETSRDVKLQETFNGIPYLYLNSNIDSIETECERVLGMSVEETDKLAEANLQWLKNNYMYHKFLPILEIKSLLK